MTIHYEDHSISKQVKTIAIAMEEKEDAQLDWKLFRSLTWTQAARCRQMNACKETAGTEYYSVLYLYSICIFN